MSFGEKLQRLRKAQGLSQEELAARLSVTRQTISKWELDQSTPELGLLAQISDIFGVTTDYLIKNEEGGPGAGGEAPGGAAQKKPQARLALFIVLLCVGILGVAVIWLLYNFSPPATVHIGDISYSGFTGFLMTYNCRPIFYPCIAAALVGLFGLIHLASKEGEPKES